MKCPRCGQLASKANPEDQFKCRSCGWRLGRSRLRGSNAVILAAFFLLFCPASRSQSITLSWPDPPAKQPKTSPTPAPPQNPPKQGPQDYSQEPYVIEELINTVSFTNDGIATQKTNVRVRIQSAGGIQEFGLLRYPYSSSIGDAEFSFVKVTKPGGLVIETPQQDVRDMSAQITVAAPFYSDLKEKQVPVKGLEIGDILEYENQFHGRAPIVAGQFFFDSNFFTQGIVLREELHFKCRGIVSSS
jgi:hypothetical protein